MSSRTDLPLRPSHVVGLLCILPWFLMLAFVLLLARDFGHALLALAVPVLAGAVFQYRRTGLLRGRNAVVGLRIDSGRLHACLGNGSVQAVLTADESRVGARFALLKLHSTGSISGTYSVVLIAAGPGLCNTAPEEFRRLRAWLRLGPSAGAQKPGARQPAEIQETH